ncbi:MFS transporter [Sphaerisporangium sp. NBC_01403]|uniref:MFS transporter n=1 Tax=Sphaerisporangium sp. NBC_01403 TaxID=2903599 RepID=UPI00324A8F71
MSAKHFTAARDLGALARYVAAATLARGADGGAAVGLVTLAAVHLRDGAAVGGVLAAVLTAPHLLGPWTARRLDRARDGRRFLAMSFAGYGIALAGGAALVGHASLPLVAVLIGLAGLSGPLLTGGLSSRLSAIAGPEARSQRRAEGLDAVSYGLGNTAGPAAVAGTAAMTTPLVAMLLLGGAAVTAAAITMTLPRDTARRSSPEDVPAVRAALRMMLATGPLRRVTIAAAFPAFCVGALSLVAVVFGSQLSARPGAGAALAAAFGFGNLAGSLAVTAFPLRGEPETLAIRHAVIMAVAFGVCALAPTYLTAVVAFAVTGACNAPLFTASLAARSLYSEPRARAQVFVSMAAFKMTMASAGAAAAGAAIGHGPRALLAAGAAMVMLTALAALLDRHSAAVRRGRVGLARSRE